MLLIIKSHPVRKRTPGLGEGGGARGEGGEITFTVKVVRGVRVGLMDGDGGCSEEHLLHTRLHLVTEDRQRRAFIIGSELNAHLQILINKPQQQNTHTNTHFFFHLCFVHPDGFPNKSESNIHKINRSADNQACADFDRK